MAPLRGSRNRRSAVSSAPSNSTPNTPAPAPGSHQAGLAVGAQTAQQMNATVQRAARQIRGPQSALTDFLASHNISANQIRQDANARRAAALANQQTENGGGEEEEEEEPESEPEPAPRKRRNETKAQEKKRKQEEEKAIAKIKASKKFQRKRRGYASDDDITDEDEAARAIFKESMAPVPGQMENCEICDKRFTVTGYSRAGPDGGLLCPTCTKEIDKEEGAERKRKQTAHRNKRRKIQSDLLDGIYPGAKDLVTLCVETLAKNVDMAEDFGDLPPALIDRLAQILGKKRLMNPSILDLFLRPGSDTVTIYEGAKLSSDDYIRIFQIVPTVKHLRIRNGVQFKNKVMDHLLGTTVALESLSLHGANLIDNERWDRFLQEKGHTLKALKVYYTDGQFGDQQVELLTKNTPNLERLKISHNQRVSDAGLKHIAKLSNLKHLGLELYEGKTSSEPYVEILNAVGPNLRTLSLGQVHYLNDTVLEAIHDNCQNMSKLRITDNEVFTDEGFAALFTNWYNPPLTFIDLHKCRHLDSAVPRDNPDGIGLCSLGFTALMQHSGSRLKYLNIHSCRHISAESFDKAFDKDKKYPDMLNIDISFCQAVNDFIVGSIFRSCPNLKTLKVFGNFGVQNVKVPKGKILIGMPNALGMQIEGADDEGREI